MNYQNREIVNILSLILQIISLDLIKKDYNNTDLMQELQNQDRNYLEKIIKQNEEIINLLRKEDTKNARKTN